MAGPLEEFVKRVHRRIDAFRELHGLSDVAVTVELFDGSLHQLASLSAEPGFGFVTLSPHGDPAEPLEMIVPVGAIRVITLGVPEQEQHFGFTVPAEG